MDKTSISEICPEEGVEANNLNDGMLMCIYEKTLNLNTATQECQFW